MYGSLIPCGSLALCVTPKAAPGTTRMTKKQDMPSEIKNHQHRSGLVHPSKHKW